MFPDRSTDGREGGDWVFFGKREPWQNRMFFSQEAGRFVGLVFIGVISIAKGGYIDREAATPPYTSFLSDIRDRG